MAASLDAVAGPRSRKIHPTTDVVTNAGEDGDAMLLARIGRGEERALAELVQRHGGRIRSLALRFTGSTADADDVVQDTFWSVWRKADRWDPRGVKVSTWIYRIALNRCIDLDRRRKVRRAVGLDSVEDPVEPAPGAEHGAVVRDELKAVTADVRALPARQRAAILLAASGELATAEIAGRLGVSEGAAEQLLVRARRTLRQNKMDRDAVGTGGAEG